MAEQCELFSPIAYNTINRKNYANIYEFDKSEHYGIYKNNNILPK